jgi:hypothetical protein
MMEPNTLFFGIRESPQLTCDTLTSQWTAYTPSNDSLFLAKLIISCTYLFILSIDDYALYSILSYPLFIVFPYLCVLPPLQILISLFILLLPYMLPLSLLPHNTLNVVLGTQIPLLGTLILLNYARCLLQQHKDNFNRLTPFNPVRKQGHHQQKPIYFLPTSTPSLQTVPLLAEHQPSQLDTYPEYYCNLVTISLEDDFDNSEISGSEDTRENSDLETETLYNVENLDEAFIFITSLEYGALHPDENINWEEDILIFPTEATPVKLPLTVPDLNVFTAYKRAAQKVHPVSGTFPEEARVRRSFPHNPLDSLPTLSPNPPEFIPTDRLTNDRINGLNVNENDFLWPEEEKLFKQVLKLNEATLPFEEKDRGTLSHDYFSDYIMPTVPHTPWEYKHIPIPPGIKDKVIDLLKSKIEAGVYEQSQSSYRCRWFCVLKKNGTLRMIHDLQPLNKVSIRDAGQLPIVDDFVEPYAGCQCYTVFDLFWGFDARIVHPQSRDLTAFYTPLGLLRLTALPMGYTNSPAEFQKCMTFILQDEIPDVANIFIDDLPIKGPKTQYLNTKGEPETIVANPGIRHFIWEHAQDVHRVMHRIKCAGATFSPKKTQICRPEVVIVGQKCTPAGRLPEEDRVTKILKWPTLTTTKEVRGFLGLCGTVRIWIQDYSKLARPLTELVRKDADFDWTDRCQEAFDILKEKVSSAPALRPIDYTSAQPVTLSVDTSYIAAGFILSQLDNEGKRRPARYGSLPMNERESRYSQPKLELYGLYRALCHWRIYLIGIQDLHVEVDAKYIKGMINEPDLQPNNAMNRWIQGILLFDFKLIHVPATQFKGPDALSRRRLADDEEIPDEDDSWLDDIALLMTIPNIDSITEFEFHTATRLPYPVYTLPSMDQKLSRQDQFLVDIHHFLKTLEVPATKNTQTRKHFLKRALEFYIKEDRLFKRNGHHSPLLVITKPQKRIAILTQAHEKLGHKGEQPVFDLVKTRFYWPHMRTDVHHHVASCHECQIRKVRQEVRPITISTPTTVFEKVYIDLMHMPPSGGFNFIIAAKDDLTGVSEAKPLRNKESKHIAKFFWENIYCRYGAVGHVVTDNGTEVKGAFDLLVKRLGVPQVRISPYNKHANGVVERGHYILREAIVKSCRKNKFGRIVAWHDQIAPALFADRVTVNHSTGYSPYYLLHGLEPLLPFDLFEATFMVEGFESGMSTADLLALRIRQLHKHEDDLENAAEVLKKTRIQSKAQFMKRFAHRLQKSIYNPGDLVLIRNSRLESTVTRFKFDPRYLGPYEVVKRTERGNYWVKELDGAQHAHPYASFRLMSYIYRDDPILYQLQEDEEPEIPTVPDLEKRDQELDSDPWSNESESDTSGAELNSDIEISNP